MMGMQLHAPVVPQGAPVVLSRHMRAVQHAWAELHVWPEPAQVAAPHLPLVHARPEQQSELAVQLPSWPWHAVAAPQWPSEQIIEQHCEDAAHVTSFARHTPASLGAAPPSANVPASGTFWVVQTPPNSVITHMF